MGHLFISAVPHLITKDFNLAGGAVDEHVGARADVIGVDLEVERQALHALLGREVGAQRVDPDVNLRKRADKQLG